MKTHKINRVPNTSSNFSMEFGGTTCVQERQTPLLFTKRHSRTTEKKNFSVRVPATTANLGPGFDCLGLALDLWNETTFTMTDSPSGVEIQGEGIEELPFNENNSVFQAVVRVFEYAGEKIPDGLNLHCHNGIPLKSGLGSSSAAVLTGLLAGNTLLKNPIREDELLSLGMEIEGHPDNVVPALYGGLVVVSQTGDQMLTHKVPVANLHTVIVLPKFDFPTQDARNALPKEVPYQDAVFNTGQISLVVEGLKSGDLDLLARAMQDRLHQPYRLPLIPGAVEALRSVQALGIPAALSGAGPSLIAFVRGGQVNEVSAAMQSNFDAAGISSRTFLVGTSPLGAQILHRGNS